MVKDLPILQLASLLKSWCPFQLPEDPLINCRLSACAVGALFRVLSCIYSPPSLLSDSGYLVLFWGQRGSRQGLIASMDERL